MPDLPARGNDADLDFDARGSLRESPGLGFRLDGPRPVDEQLLLALARVLLADELERVAQRLDASLRATSRRRGVSA